MNNNIKRFVMNRLPDELAAYLRLLKNDSNQKKQLEEIESIIDRDYYKLNQRHINWNEPAFYTEKMQYSKIYCANQIRSDLTDKINVRKWVEKKIGKECLVPVIGVYDHFSDIEFDTLPKAFVLKCNHDSGSVTLVPDKSLLTGDQIRKMKKSYDDFYLKRNYGYVFFEMQYAPIQPHLLIEEYLGENIRDYKFMCFNGKPYYCWVDFDRFTNHKRNIYDLNWNMQPFVQLPYTNYDKNVEKPDSFDQMVELVSILCEGFDHVRVDMFNCNGKIYFGEMTFTNGSGLEVIRPVEWDRKLGDLWPLDTSHRKKMVM
jgi:hypothetical protein